MDTTMTWTALDIGTTKICAIIASTNKAGEIEIRGIGRVASAGLSKAMIVDAAQAAKAIKEAVSLAEAQAHITADSIYLGISGSHITSINSEGVIALKNKEVRQRDIDAVINAARAIPLPEGQQILHALPQYFVIDGNHIVNNPLHMHGVRLQAYVHIIAGEVTAIENLVRCCEMAGLMVKDIILEPIASAEATLTVDEKELGAGILDIGGGTADFAIYHHGTIRHTKIIPIAGNIFTNDLAICLKTTKSEAERLKKEFGTVIIDELTQDIPLAIQSLDHDHTHIVSTKDIAYILEARAEELLKKVAHEITTYKLGQYMAGGLIVTGGGSLIRGFAPYAEQYLGIPVRLAYPRFINTSIHKDIESPLYATSYGLLLYPYLEREHTLKTYEGSVMNKVFGRMRSWVYDLF